MSFLNNFRLQYHIKHIEKLLDEENFTEIFSYLGGLNKNDELFYYLSLKYISNFINKTNENILENKIIFINSFLDEDLDFCLRFLQYYFQNNNNTFGNISSYLSEVDAVIKKDELVDFNVLVNESYFFQWMLLNKHKDKYKFISNNLPFFSSQNNYNFTKASLTQSYLLVLNDPYAVYHKIKTQNNNDQEKARNIFLNLDNQPEKISIGKTNFLLTKKGWHINSQSWTDPNVLNSLRGKVILKKDLVNDTYDTLSSIILHLVQSGVKIELNYDLIESFINQNPISTEGTYDISNKEKKFIDQYTSQILDQYDF